MLALCKEPCFCPREAPHRDVETVKNCMEMGTTLGVEGGQMKTSTFFSKEVTSSLLPVPIFLDTAVRYWLGP